MAWPRSVSGPAGNARSLRPFSARAQRERAWSNPQCAAALIDQSALFGLHFVFLENDRNRVLALPIGVSRCLKNNEVLRVDRSRRAEL